MGFWSGLKSFGSSLVSGIGSAIGSIGSSIGTAISTFAKPNRKQPSILGSIANMAVTGLVSRMINGSTKPQAQAQPSYGEGPGSSSGTAQDTGVVLDLQASTENKIPVIYGIGKTNGILTDAFLAEKEIYNTNADVMYYCLVLSEVTGNTINGDPSYMRLDKVYANGQRVRFKADGMTVDYLEAEDGTQDTKMDGKVMISFYANGSTNGIGENGVSLMDARQIFRGWDWGLHGTCSDTQYTDQTTCEAGGGTWTADLDAHAMENLCFAIVSVAYSHEKNIKGLPSLAFFVKNSMDQPGDVLYDYMTNTRYGAGIPVEDIDV